MYVLDYDRQNSLIREMTQLRKDSDNWVVYYHDPATNEMWKSYFPRATGTERGPKILRTEPVPENLEERLAQCLADDHPENAIGLGIELSVEPYRWERILQVLEAHYREYHKKQLKLFLRYLGILDPHELFNEIGFDPVGYNLSGKKIKEFAWRAKKIRFKRFWFF